MKEIDERAERTKVHREEDCCCEVVSKVESNRCLCAWNWINWRSLVLGAQCFSFAL